MTNIIDCPICRSEAECSPEYEKNMMFYACPVCGRFEIGANAISSFNVNHLSSYLFYHAFHQHMTEEMKYHTTLSKEECDEYKRIKTDHRGIPVHLDSEMVEIWYPKTFAERVDSVLLYISEHTRHMGQSINLSYNDSLSLLFIDRKDDETWRDQDVCSSEAKYLLDYLDSCHCIEYAFGIDKDLHLRLLPNGYGRVDEIQRATSHGRSVLVAMQFGDETIRLREAIRKGITDAGYFAVFIDEVQHNELITPELLKHIRDSKFVVADLSHQNNGAYFEEGYAMGLGKPVIQLCKKGIQLHFDIAQKNTIMWEIEDDIPLRLTNRIKATID